VHQRRVQPAGWAARPGSRSDERICGRSGWSRSLIENRLATQTLKQRPDRIASRDAWAIESLITASWTLGLLVDPLTAGLRAWGTLPLPRLTAIPLTIKRTITVPCPWWTPTWKEDCRAGTQCRWSATATNSLPAGTGKVSNWSARFRAEPQSASTPPPSREQVGSCNKQVRASAANSKSRKRTLLEQQRQVAGTGVRGKSLTRPNRGHARSGGRQPGPRSLRWRCWCVTA